MEWDDNVEMHMRALVEWIEWDWEARPEFYAGRKHDWHNVRLALLNLLTDPQGTGGQAQRIDMATRGAASGQAHPWGG